MEQVVSFLNDILWGPVMIYGILIVGLFFSILTKFAQVRLIGDMFKLMFAGEKSDAGVSSFQAMSIALSGRVGTGNIIGTASAIAFGGPGAVFWMWVTAFIGASTAYMESTLAQIYKEKKDGQYRGGPAFYIEKSTGIRILGVIFACAMILSVAVLMPGVQSNAIAGAIENAFGIAKWFTGVVTVLLLGVIIFGGVKRIANVAQVLVPFMALGYLLVAFIIIFMNISAVPEVLGLIFRSAFSTDAMFGGMIGSAIFWGVKRAIYSNEAGQGTGPHPAAAAEVSHPAKQGLVQAASIYIDTLLVCSATALMILFMGTYNVHDGSQDGILVEAKLDEAITYSGFTQAAVNDAFPTLNNFGSGFVAVSLFLFAFTTLMAYYYIAETNVSYMFKGSAEKIGIFLMKFVLLASAFYGTVKESDLAWAFGDAGLGLTVWINVIMMLFIMKPALLALKDYEQQKKEGKDPVFNPRKLGIKNADFWETYRKGK